MYLSEKVFVKKFLACLRKQDIREIPYDNPAFYSGIERMGLYYDAMKDSLGKYKDEIGLLFIRHSIDGVFTEFKSEISNQNGKLLEFGNPHYIRAVITIDEKSSDYIMCHGDIDIQNEIIKEFTVQFCEGANLKAS